MMLSVVRTPEADTVTTLAHAPEAMALVPRAAVPLAIVWVRLPFGPTGVPLKVGEDEKTTFPVPVAPVAVCPPIEICVPKACKAVQVFAWPRFKEPTTAPVVGVMVKVPSLLLTDETAPVQVAVVQSVPLELGRVIAVVPRAPVGGETVSVPLVAF
jgi:hypothetical protein